MEDTGIGVPPDKQALIFESFTQADGSTCRRYGGAGLGLAITKSLSEMLGGELILASRQDQGSTFSLTIPAGVAPGTALPPQADTLHAAATDNDPYRQSDVVTFSGQVLVADDDPGNQKLIKRLLERLGFDVTTADDGTEAVEKAETGEFDMIFMDVQMPVMDGLRATSLLRQKEIATPIIALTAHAFEQDKTRCLQAGCNDYLAKPIEHDILVKIIAQHAPHPVPTA